MKRNWKLLALGILAPLAFGGAARAMDEPAFINATFQDILRRVVRRDPESRAILGVERKADAPGGGELAFSIVQDSPGDREAVVKLGKSLKAGDGDVEKYRLRMDEAMRHELENQTRLTQSAQARSSEAADARRKAIAQLSGNALREGMSLEEVIRAKGQPRRIESVIHTGARAQAPEFKAVYADAEILFRGDVSKEPKLFSILPSERR